MDSSSWRGWDWKPRGPDRPRRRETPYRYTPARRAAGLRSLKLATLARMLHHYPRRVTPEQRSKALAGLLLAGAARPFKGDCRRHGLYAVFLPEKLRPPERAEFEAHLGRFERALAAGPEGACEEQSRLIRGAAELVWRQVQVFYRQGEWEREAVRKILARFDGYPISGDLRDTLADQLYGFLNASYPKLDLPLDRLHRRLEQVLGALYRGRFGADLGFRIFGSRRSPALQPESSPETLSNPALSKRQVRLVKVNHEERQRCDSGAAGAPREETAAPAASTKNDADWRGPFRRMFPGNDPPAPGPMQAAANRLEEALGGRLEVFPRYAQLQADGVREMMERVDGVAPLSEHDMGIVLTGLLKGCNANRALVNALEDSQNLLLDALIEWMRSPYLRCPRPATPGPDGSCPDVG